MAKAATSKGVPNFQTMNLEERSLWFLEQLRKLPGETVTDDKGTWLKLNASGSLKTILIGLAPGLTHGRADSIASRLGERGLRWSKNKGGGHAAHYIKLEPENAPADVSATDVPAEIDAGIETDIAAAVAILNRAATVITEQRGRVTELEAEVAELRRELQFARKIADRLNTENTDLKERPALAPAFRDGLAQLERTLNADTPT